MALPAGVLRTCIDAEEEEWQRAIPPAWNAAVTVMCKAPAWLRQESLSPRTRTGSCTMGVPSCLLVSPLTFHAKELEKKFLLYQRQCNIRTAALHAITLGIMLPAMLIVRCAIEGNLSPASLRWLLLTIGLSASFILFTSSPHVVPQGHMIPCLIFLIRCHFTITAIMVPTPSSPFQQHVETPRSPNNSQEVPQSQNISCSFP